MQAPANTQTTIPQHVLDQMENEWRQIRLERENARPDPGASTTALRDTGKAVQM
ncbi:MULTISPECIES: hypothetical protein [Rhizobium]|uniref:hypothetical protein n=1 Tax=Rhizobium TaxID=379 RepID=UPI001B31D73A|nr:MULTISPECIES: hypothetical protein [Rhizobium]MBX4908172.1 hypothetical protein [Rhizobium bangladeshense]MBX5217057.1 hypothetical protein [Rhizobium sp. NLR9a]MBX5222525.1 hypothetical protein [Rhizobium sp. NLR8a]MBX5227826.1 hypothetical protein [Rhizobium sp. NLR9b]MBX5233388.1 hypothetical protein [Rhizobium sp. NLR4a]